MCNAIPACFGRCSSSACSCITAARSPKGRVFNLPRCIECGPKGVHARRCSSRTESRRPGNLGGTCTLDSHVKAKECPGTPLPPPSPNASARFEMQITRREFNKNFRRIVRTGNMPAARERPPFLSARLRSSASGSIRPAAQARYREIFRVARGEERSVDDRAL